MLNRNRRVVRRKHWREGIGKNKERTTEMLWGWARVADWEGDKN